MKVIKYKMKQSDTLIDVSIGYNDINLGIAKKEAHNGEYIIEDDGEPEPEIEANTDEVVNKMLGVE